MIAGCAVALGVAMLAPQGVAAQGGPCEGFASDRVLSTLGGPNAFAAPLETKEELQARIEGLELDIRHIFEERGMLHLADAFIAAVKAGQVEDRQLERGEIFEWMAYRKGGEPTTYGELCVDTGKIYDAFRVTVKEERELGGEPPTCGLDVTRDCEGGVEVEATGSFEAVTVRMGSTTVLPRGTDRTWSGEDPEPYGGDLSFTVEAERRGPKEVITHHFVIPKVCFNFAYTGSERSDSDEPGETVTCEKTVTVPACGAPAPSCSLSVPTEARPGEPVSVDVTGSWAGNQIEIVVTDDEGMAVSDPMISGPFPTTVTFPKGGDYTLTGTATNAAGETATCTAGIGVSSLWTLRAFAGRINTDDDQIETSGVAADGRDERSKFGFGNGEIFGLSLERLFNPRTGLELAALVGGDLDSSLVSDRGQEWEMDSDSVDVSAFSLGLNFHLTPNARADFYLGPFVALVDYGDATFETFGETNRRSFGNEFGIGAQVGLDIPFGAASPWAFHLGGRYFDSSADEEMLNEEIDINPLIFEAGIAFDF